MLAAEIITDLNYSPFRRKISKSLNTLRQFHHEFVLSSKGVDWDSKSHLNKGSAKEKQLIYYVEHAYDIMYCLHVYQKTIDVCHKQSNENIRDADKIYTYLKAVPLSQNFYDLIADVLLNSHLIDKHAKKYKI